MKSLLRTCTLTAIAILGPYGVASLEAQQPTGQWDFELGNLNATVGQPLQYADAPTEQGTRFGTATSFGIPNIGGAPAQVMKYPASIAPSGYWMPTPTNANGGGSLVNEWTIIYDILFTSESDQKWRALIDTDGGVVDADAELFVDPNNQLGVGQFFGSIQSNTWYRIAMVVQTSSNRLSFYVDGVHVGTRNSGGAGGFDGRWALPLSGTVGLFNDNDTNAAPGYVNSIQLRDVALTDLQMRALGGPVASGIPTNLPPVPSFIKRWIPPATFGSRDTDVGVVIHAGDTAIQNSSITLKLDGTVVGNPQITMNGPIITVQKSGGSPFVLGSTHTLEVTYTDSLAGLKTNTHQFTALLFYEDFDGLDLGPNVNEGLAGDEVWTKTAPAGWTFDDTGVPGVGDDTTDGVTEWAGWSFANRDWWVTTAGDQNRSFFTKATGAVAIADPDEWDDAGHDFGMYNTFLKTKEISLIGIAPNTVLLTFDSSWRDECCDDSPDLDNSQTATVTVSYNGGPATNVLKWDSTPTSATFHDDNENESVTLDLHNPAGATNLVITFGLTLAENDWWWAVDNIALRVGAVAPTINSQPASQVAYSGADVTFKVSAGGTEPLGYQWRINNTNINGATGTNYTRPNVQASDTGDYTVVVSNVSGSVTSLVARLELFAGPITQGLVTHLKLDNNLTDSSGRNNNGAAVGSPEFGAGKVGANALHIPSGADYVTLGTPADLNFGTSTDFSIAFWAKLTAWSGDPSFIANKDWDSGGNPGYVISTDDDGRIQWNLAGPPGNRKDFDSAGGKFSDTNWHHVVVTFNRDGDASTYLDGALVAQAGNPTPLSANQNNLDTPAGNATNIGQDGAGDYGSAFTDADVDDLGIWRRVLTAQEVAAVYAKGQEGLDLTTATGATAPAITLHPQSVTVSPGANVSLNVAATGTVPFTYQWKRNGADVGGAVGATLNLDNIQTAQAGDYTVVLGNAGGVATSIVARVDVFVGLVTQELVVHLKFDNNLSDSSGRGNNGTAVGAPTFAAGKVGANAVHLSSGTDYVTLGAPADLNFGTDTDFSVAFWAKAVTWSGDPSFIANKDWDSGSNPGWVIATDSDGRLQWNAAGKPDGTNGDRKDFDGPGGVFTGGNWHHVVVTYDRSGNAITYVDGVQSAHRDGRLFIPVATPPNNLNTPTGKATNIGQDGAGDYGSVFTDADMDDLGIWRRVLTPQEAAAIFTAGQGGRDLSTAGVGQAGAVITSVSVSGGTINITVTGTAPGSALEFRSDLNPGTSWQPVGPISGSTSIPVSGAQGYYRVVSP